MKKILVVEDDKFLADAYRMRLESDKIQVINAFDGEEALKKIHDESPDLIILDIIIPKKDGLTILEEIKKDPSLKQVPVIIASNVDGSAQIERALILGANDYIVKSNISLSTVAEMVDSIIK